MNMPIVTLTAGLRVGNFSSPHTFTFTDGTVLEACPVERVNLGKLNAVEREIARGIAGRTWSDIELGFELNEAIVDMLENAYVKWCAGEVDIVICPFPVITAMKAARPDALGWDASDGNHHPFRTIRSADRITKVNHADRFCV